MSELASIVLSHLGPVGLLVFSVSGFIVGLLAILFVIACINKMIKDCGNAYESGKEESWMVERNRSHFAFNRRMNESDDNDDLTNISAGRRTRY
jgi:hypothetical protein